MDRWSLREGLHFAFATEFLSKKNGKEAYQKNLSEKFGFLVLKPLFRFIDLVSKSIKEPLAICLFTLLAALTAGLVFYNVPAIILFGNLIPLQALRGIFFIYVELNLFAMGCRAFGRFNNKTLVNLWKNSHLIAVFPGDLNARSDF